MKMEFGTYQIVETNTILMDSLKSELVLRPVIADVALEPIIIKFCDGGWRKQPRCKYCRQLFGNLLY